jgi:hypothetical protein
VERVQKKIPAEHISQDLAHPKCLETRQINATLSTRTERASIGVGWFLCKRFSFAISGSSFQKNIDTKQCLPVV